MSTAPHSFSFPRAMKLRGRILFDTLYKTGKRRTAHPLTVHALRRQDNTPSRLGISIGTRCGNAVQRNLIKRRLREAFRLMQHDLPPGFDYLVVVKPHTPLPTADYQSRFRPLLTERNP
jgi:ribonuclease P protein component